MASNDKSGQGQPGVRFASRDDEINSGGDLHIVRTLTAHEGWSRDDLNEEAEQELQKLKTTLQNNIQSARMQHHNFEPVSLPGSAPVSRVASGTGTPKRRHLPAGSRDPSPRRSSPTASAVHSPPLTPAATHSADGKTSVSAVPVRRSIVPDVMTPQRSASPQREKDAQGDSSAPPSTLPVASTGSRPATPSSGQPTKSIADMSIDERFRFGNRDPSLGYANSGQAAAAVPSVTTTSKPSTLGANLRPSENKRASFFGGSSSYSSKRHEDESSAHASEKHHSSLKRFFKIGDHKKDKEKEKREDKKDARKDEAAIAANKETAKTLPSTAPPVMPFADDHGLETKYGKFGRVLGQGAGGSVRLMKRTGDGVVFAVKQFRDRHGYETEKEYNKKVTAEFCIGSTLHHGNVIETIDIIHEKGKWFEVMEYAPFDLFATVMTGKMSRDETTCATLQILSGVCYLHTMGLAHRDLKLDNVVINERGIMKLIDFGSAVVFRYPFENDIVLATGVVGSDPYLAPEVYDNQRYDPRLADVWSIAIIFCCMTLRRFPWKAPRLSDNSYRLFVAEPDPDQDKILDAYRKTSSRSNRDSVASIDGPRKEAKSEPASHYAEKNGKSGVDSTTTTDSQHRHHHRHHHYDEDKAIKSEPVSRQSTATGETPAVIKGPMRLLRLLPRETRHIIGRMLVLNPKDRADMDEILDDPWVQDALVCRQEENGVVYSAPNHTHTLQPSGGAH